jgi:DNA-binding transcriptional ArsR family regulator
VGSEKVKRPKKRVPLISQETIKALSHGLRVDLLRVLNERTASPNELAKELDEDLTQVSYHVKILKNCKYLVEVKNEPRRGAVEHYYKATRAALIDDDLAAKLPKVVRETLSVEALEAIYGEAAESIRTGSFDKRTDRHVSWVPMRLDEEGWKALMALLMDTLGKAEKIKADSAERLAGEGEAGNGVIVSLMGFESAPAPGIP